MTFAAAETRSFERAGLVMRNVGDQPISAKTIERVVHDVGWELAERRDADPKTAENRGGVICLNLFLTVYSSIFLQNRGLRNHRGGVAPGAVSLPGADGSTC